MHGVYSYKMWNKKIYRIVIMKRILVTLLISLSLLGCDAPPVHTVIDSPSMVVYRIREASKRSQRKWEYWVTDGSDINWRFISNKEFKVGDRLIVGIEK